MRAPSIFGNLPVRVRVIVFVGNVFMSLQLFPFIESANLRLSLADPPAAVIENLLRLFILAFPVMDRSYEPSAGSSPSPGGIGLFSQADKSLVSASGEFVGDGLLR